MEKKQRVYSTKTKIIRGILTLFLVIVAALTVYPLVYIILGSFKENAEPIFFRKNLFWIITKKRGKRPILQDILSIVL